jgi:hypothetical protein
MNLNLLSVLLGTLILPVELMLELTGMSADRSNPAPVILTCLVAIAFMVRTCSRVRRLRYITAISCSWWAICVGFIGWRACQLYGWSWVNVQTLGSCITIGALYALWAYAWHVLSNRRKILAYLIAATFPFLFVLISVTNMTQAISNLPKVYDPTIYAIQTTMHLDGSRLFAVAAQEFNPFKRVMVFMYTSTPIWMLLAALLQSLNAQAEHSWFLLCSFILGLAGFGLYYVTPAIGPVGFSLYHGAFTYFQKRHAIATCGVCTVDLSCSQAVCLVVPDAGQPVGYMHHDVDTSAGRTLRRRSNSGLPSDFMHPRPMRSQCTSSLPRAVSSRYWRRGAD